MIFQGAKGTPLTTMPIVEAAPAAVASRPDTTNTIATHATIRIGSLMLLRSIFVDTPGMGVVMVAVPYNIDLQADGRSPDEALKIRATEELRTWQRPLRYKNRNLVHVSQRPVLLPCYSGGGATSNKADRRSA